MTGHGEERGIKVVVQRCNSAKLLLDNKNEWGNIERGMILFVSFSKGANASGIPTAIDTLLSLPIVSLGSWGDENKPQPFTKLIKDGNKVQIMIIPQAGLTCKYKRNSLQYTNQLPKEESKNLYDLFCRSVDKQIRNCLHPPPETPANHWKPKIPVSPEILFRSGDWKGQFSQYDKDHVPTHDQDGNVLSKARRKKVLKVAIAAKKKYEIFLKDNPDQLKAPKRETDIDISANETVLPINASEKLSKSLTAFEPALDSSGNPYVVAGTFGNRQALIMDSQCGPNTHYFEF